LAQCVERNRAFNPGVSLPDGLTNGRWTVRVASVQAWFTSIVAAAQLSHSYRALAEPKFPLRRAACKNHMREFLNFFSQCFVGCLPNSGYAITFASSDRNQDVFLRPLAFIEYLAQFREIDFELSGPVCERRPIISNCRIRTLPKSDKVPTRAVKSVSMRVELQSAEDPLKFGDVVRIFGGHQKMKVNESGLRRHIEPDLDIGKNELNVGETPCSLLPEHMFI
jgi:hypothetical protein